jgi:hypothetical protein
MMPPNERECICEKAIHPSAWKRNSPKFAACRGSKKPASSVTFIVDSSPLAMVMVGWVYLL